MDDSAVSADAIKTGVTNDDHYETSVVEIHGFGKRHSCDDPACVRCCGNSTAGPALEGRQRAGDVRPDEGFPDPERLIARNNPKIAEGNAQEIAEGVEEEEHQDCDLPDCARCNRVDERTLQPDISISKGGGSSGKIKKQKPKPISTVDRIRDDLYPEKETEEQRAERLMRESEVQSNRNPGPGHPIRGREKRMHIQGTLEPSTVHDLNVTTGMKCVPLLEEMQKLLSLAKSGAEAQAIYERVMGLIQRPENTEAA
jgi:hypothetical protein